MARQFEGSGAVLSDAEEGAIRAVLRAGATFGYGNMIAHLQTAWAMMLMAQYGMDEKTARHASGGHEFSGYPGEFACELCGRVSIDGRPHLACLKAAREAVAGTMTSREVAAVLGVGGPER